MESQPQNPELMINTENFHPCRDLKLCLYLPNILFASSECSGKAAHLGRVPEPPMP